MTGEEHCYAVRRSHAVKYRQNVEMITEGYKLQLKSLNSLMGIASAAILEI